MWLIGRPLLADLETRLDTQSANVIRFQQLEREAEASRLLKEGTEREFYAALKHDGFLILDQRNYDMILDAKTGISRRTNDQIILDHLQADFEKFLLLFLIHF